MIEIRRSLGSGGQGSPSPGVARGAAFPNLSKTVRESAGLPEES